MKRQQDHDEDVPFDVAPAAPAAQTPPSVAPKDLLSAAKVEAVRFHPAKPGYAYDQVETFVDAVTRTLRYLEERMYQDDLALHEAAHEQELLEEQIATLKATIEVFRANGDPVGAADGGFATASTIDDSALRAERDSLAAALAASQAEVADLRVYIDEQLAPWSEEHEAAASEPAGVSEHSGEDDSTEAEVAAEPEIVEETVIVAVEEVEESPDEKAVFAATAAAFAAQSDDSDDWDDASEMTLEDDTPDVEDEPVVSTEAAPVAASGPLFSTPEIEGVQIDPSKVIRTDDSQYERVSPPKAGTPLPRLLPPEIEAMMNSEDFE